MRRSGTLVPIGAVNVRASLRLRKLLCSKLEVPHMRVSTMVPPTSESVAGGRWPVVIQGGMGVAVSSWQLARTVSQVGQLGVVSGTALDVVIARRLQDGDVDGDTRRALEAFRSEEHTSELQS